MAPDELTAVRLEPLRAHHLDAVVRIERAVAPRGWSRRVFLGELARPDTRWYVAAVTGAGADATVHGYGGIQLHLDEAHVTTLTVAPAARRRGIATRMLVALLRQVRRRGARAATLEVRAGNAAARQLYARFGFAPVGVRPKYYEGVEDALIMWAHDVDSEAYGALLAALDTGSHGGAPLPWDDDDRNV